jgi:cytochrome P450 family 142 subfamily A polypeptide 1
MLGFPEDAYDDLLRWSDDLMRGTDVNADEEAGRRSMQASIGFRELQLGVIADRRAKPPQDDLISVLCHAEIDGEQLDDESLVMETLLILIGGDETSRHVISHGMLTLMDHPDQRAILTGADEETMATGVEELLRWVTPIKNMSRTVARDVEFGGQQLHAEDQVILLYPSANRDEAVFDDPYRFDVRRTPNPHLAFGFGTHFCLGASLARLELQVMFDEVLRRLPDIELAADGPLEFRPSNFIVGPEAMPVRFTPAPATK